MKIVHVCLESPFVDGLGYQENILTKMHAELGYETIVITCFEKNKKGKSSYTDQYGVKIKRIFPQKSFLSKYRLYEGLYEKLTEICPDIIFVHGVMSLSLVDVIKYCKRNKDIPVYIDSHADFYNTPVNTFKKRMFYRYVYGSILHRAIKYVKVFWGVTPWRCQYLNEVLGIPEEKIDLLVMGGDDSKIDLENRDIIRERIRNDLKLSDDDFVVITGGKIDCEKKVHLLLDAVGELKGINIKLIIFGKLTEDFIRKFGELSNRKNAINIGWIPAEKVYDYFLASDVAVFPGTHSVLWEQACACGIPIVAKRWPGMQHIDVGGNAIFLNQDSSTEIKEILLDLYYDKDKYNAIKNIAINKGAREFSYSTISKKAIGIEDYK